MTAKTPSHPGVKRSRWKFVSLKEERLERKLALAFGFMLFIPILILVWAMVYAVELGLVIFLVSASSFIGYFMVARPMITSASRPIPAGASMRP